jgi:hypothetical protein
VTSPRSPVGIRGPHRGWLSESLRRSLVMWPPLDPWAGPGAFERLVESFRETGIREFIAMLPPDDRLGLLERAARSISSLRVALRTDRMIHGSVDARRGSAVPTS